MLSQVEACLEIEEGVRRIQGAFASVYRSTGTVYKAAIIGQQSIDGFDVARI